MSRLGGTSLYSLGTPRFVRSGHTPAGTVVPPPAHRAPASPSVGTGAGRLPGRPSGVSLSRPRVSRLQYPVLGVFFRCGRAYKSSTLSLRSDGRTKFSRE